MMGKTLSCSGLRYPVCFRSLPSGMWTGMSPELPILSKAAIRLKDGTTALSAAEKIERGKTAIGALAAYRAAKSAGHEEDAAVAYQVLQENMPYFGYGYIKDVNQPGSECSSELLRFPYNGYPGRIFYPFLHSCALLYI